MWTFTTGTVAGVSTTKVNKALAVVQDAANHWGRYLNFNGATLDITVNFVSLGETALAQAGSTFSSVGGGNFQVDTILELKTGVDQNGAAVDIDIDINADVINANDFYFGLSGGANPPSVLFDLFTVLIHEIGHGLGFVSLFDQPETAVFDTFVSGLPAAPVFTGAAAVAAFGGVVPLDSDPSHLDGSLGGFVMVPAVSAGVRKFLSNVDVAILQDVGLPILVPTSGADTLFGFGTADNIALLGGNDIYNGLGGSDIVDGGAGDDTLIGGPGADTLNGGAGTDTADYSDASSGVSILLWNGTGSGNIAQGDVLTGIENVTGSSFNDTLAGANGVSNVIDGLAGGDLITGLSGNDSLISGAGADTLDGGAGADTLDGGAGSDIASYASASGAVVVNLLLGTGLGGDAAGDVLSSIERLTGSHLTTR